MFECPSRLKQRGATCLIQNQCNLRVVCSYIGENNNSSTLSLHLPICPPSTHPIITLLLMTLNSCESPTGLLLCMIVGRENVTWVLCFWGHSLLPSHRANAVLLSLGLVEQNFTSARAGYYPQLGIISYTGYMVPLSFTLYLTGSDQPIYTMGIWQEKSKHLGMNMCASVLVCVCVCVARQSRRGVGESNLSHRGAETGGQIRSRPRITQAVSMNEMTGLQGY